MRRRDPIAAMRRHDLPVTSRRRRDVVAALALAFASALAGPAARAHTPYRQWQVYRRKHLLIGCHREDPAGYALAKAIVEHLDTHLPDARARVARGPNAGRLASLLATEQMDVALLGDTDALAMSRGADDFGPYGAIALRTLVRLPGRVLVARADFPERHAWLVADALADLPVPDAVGAPSDAPSPLDRHPGAERRRRGLPLPATLP